MTEITLTSEDVSFVLKYFSEECVENIVESEEVEDDIRCKILSCLVLEKRLKGALALNVLKKCLIRLTLRPSSQIISLIGICYNSLDNSRRTEAFDEIFSLVRSLLNEENAGEAFVRGTALCRQICSGYIEQTSNEALTSFMVNVCFTCNVSQLKKLMPPLETLVSVQSDDCFLKNLWTRIEENHGAKKDDSLIRALVILCCLGRRFVILTSSSTFHSLLNVTSFWDIVQEGLASSLSVVRKQSLHMLKLSILALESTKNVLELPKFKWSQTEGSQALTLLCLACEVAEECQPHMVLPIFKILDSLAEFCGSGILDPSWLFSMYIRLLRHESFHVSRCALKSFCSAPAHCFSSESYNYLPVFVEFFTTCNNMLLFNSSSNRSETIEELLTQWFSLLPPKAFDHILPSLIQTRWGPIPLYHIMHCLCQSKKRSLWTNSSLIELKQFVKSFLVSQNLTIRRAIQTTTLRCLFNLAASPLELNTIAQLLSAFPSNESLTRNRPVWGECVQWLTSIVDELQVNVFISNLTEQMRDPTSHDMVSPSVTARMLVLLHDGCLSYPRLDLATSRLATSLYSHFHQCNERAYSSYENQLFCVRFLNCLLKEARGESLPDCLIESMRVLSESSLMFEFIDSVFRFKIKCAVTDAVWSDIDEILTLERSISTLANSMKRGEIKNQFELYFLFGKIETILTHLSSEADHLAPCFEDFLDPRDDPRLPVQSKLLPKAWSLRSIISRIPLNRVKWLGSPRLLDAAITALTVGGKDMVVYVLQVFSVVLPMHSDNETVMECLSRAWSACFDNRRSELFWESIRWWIEAAFQPDLLERSELTVYLKQKAFELINLGNDVKGVSNLVSSHLHRCWEIANLIDYVEVIAECLLFGPVPRRDQRIEDDTCELIRSRLGDDCVKEDRQKCKKSSEVRICALATVLYSKNDEFKIALMNALVELDGELAKENKKYFNDSEVHRKRNRLWQALVVLERIVQAPESKEKLFKWLTENLLNCSHQPSVRYLMEWIFVRMCYNQRSIEQYWGLFETSSSKPGSQCSFISIGFHLCHLLSDNSFFERFIENILPCCMSQNFNVRLYSQVALQKLWAMFPTIDQKYHFIRKNQHKVFEQGNAKVNAQKMESEFYFNCSQNILDFTLKTIFWDIPRLSNLTEDEWVSCDELESVMTRPSVVVSVGVSEKSLDKFMTASWIPRVACNDDKDSTASAIQKKYMPTKSSDLVNAQDSLAGERQKKLGSLVLVTSLLDKASNLGGLARTGDIFGVHQLVVGSLQSLTDKNFTSLSMTAESHLDIREVKPFNLKEYFKVLKDQGYTLVGAEQTTESIPLSQFTFPYKTALLLGNEREGVPADLLSSVDLFVEIPQFGVIRSLNVHVTGAILMWEYAKQHFLGSKIPVA